MRCKRQGMGRATQVCEGAVRNGSEDRSQLPNNTHFSSGIFANANWLDPVFEFPPTPFPVNHRYETVEGGRYGFGGTVFHPDTEPRWVFAFIDAGGRSAHSLTPWAVPALNLQRGHRPLEYVLAIPQKLGCGIHLRGRGAIGSPNTSRRLHCI